MSDQQLLTTGDLVRLTGERLHRLRYALDSARIEPRQRAGIVRLFSADQLPAIFSALGRTRREPSHS